MTDNCLGHKMSSQVAVGRGREPAPARPTWGAVGLWGIQEHRPCDPTCLPECPEIVLSSGSWVREQKPRGKLRDLAGALSWRTGRSVVGGEEPRADHQGSARCPKLLNLTLTWPSQGWGGMCGALASETSKVVSAGHTCAAASSAPCLGRQLVAVSVPCPDAGSSSPVLPTEKEGPGPALLQGHQADPPGREPDLLNLNLMFWDLYGVR